MVNPWHDVNYGHRVPEVVTVFIEVPKNSVLKYELDKETGLIKVDRALYSAVHYPGDYGFIPQTYWDDGDPLDVLVLSNFPVYPGVLMQARVIGVLHMVDNEERDDKIIAVPENDPRFERYHDIDDVPHHVILEIKHFFETYKELQNKKVKIVAMQHGETARKDVLKGIENYKKEFGKESLKEKLKNKILRK